MSNFLAVLGQSCYVENMNTNNAIIQVKMCERCGSDSTEYEVVQVAGHEFCDGCILEAMAMQQWRDLRSSEKDQININVGFMGSC